MQVPLIKIILSRVQANYPISTYIEEEGEDALNRHIVSHVINTLDGKIKHNLLCQFEDEYGAKYNVTLDKESWKKSLSKAHQYFLKIEEYETCKIIKETLEKI